MNKPSLKLVLFFIIGMLAAFLVMYSINDYRNGKEQSSTTAEKTELSPQINKAEIQIPAQTVGTNGIDELTNENVVINYVKINYKLPDYYVTKAKARDQGWVASEGNLCDALPGKAIGGDKFSNREKLLPKGNQYFEADVNYQCGRRNADRIVYTKNGDVWLTKDHYKTFEKK